MKLAYVKIENFRSIKSARIDFSRPCRALIGINESGKTNVLHALALLNPDRTIDVNDLRQTAGDETPITDAEVWFTFNLEVIDHEGILEEIEASLLGSLNDAIFQNSDETLGGYVKSIRQSLYCANLVERKKFASYFSLPKNKKVLDGWVVPKPGAAATEVVNERGESINITSCKILHKSQLPDELHQHCIPLTTESLNRLIGKAITTWTIAHLPACVFWSYSEAQLLPASIEVSTFRSSPSSYEPLKQMFLLGGHNDVDSAITEAEARAFGLKNLLRKVSQAATKHLHTVWNEYKGIEVLLESNGTRIDVSIKDKHNQYDFAMRSDGFKRFISFLFLVSAKNKNGELENVLYLHDEPDAGLHPSGIRHLMKELIEVSKKNYVVYSTHSIFMIDSNKIDRHYIVRKADENTVLHEANKSNFQDEEVLFKALGFSSFELLKSRNLLFEGWKDKRFFEVATKSNKFKTLLGNKLKDVGMCFVNGVKDASSVVSTLELGNRGWLVISDSDKTALEHQKKFEGSSPDWAGTWKTYDQLGASNVQTVEDFFEPKKFIAVVNSILSSFSISLQIKEVPPHGRLEYISGEFSKLKIDRDSSKAYIDRIKDELFEQLMAKDIEIKYEAIIKSVVEAIS
ncbi:MAG: AAA family ATPase [Pirellulaceae bacterium]|nr:AAA family ATPase [Pirellulaceae bacterium]